MQQRNVTEELVSWLRQRERIGYERYGKPLRSFGDHRNLAREALEEALDLIQYLYGFALEREELLQSTKESGRIRRVYVAGPYTGDGSTSEKEQNTARAIEVGERLFNLGFKPYVPHLNHFWDIRHSHSPEEWLALDFEWLAQSQAMLLIPGKSPGAEREQGFANSLKIPIFTSVEELIRYAEQPEVQGR